jgi:hypothetical protein
MITSFGRHQLPVFTVFTEELPEREAPEKVTLAA